GLLAARHPLAGSPGSESATLALVHRPFDFPRGFLTVPASSGSSLWHWFLLWPRSIRLLRDEPARALRGRGRRLYVDKAISLPGRAGSDRGTDSAVPFRGTSGPSLFGSDPVSSFPSPERFERSRR